MLGVKKGQVWKRQEKGGRRELMKKVESGEDIKSEEREGDKKKKEEKQG